MRKKSLAVLLVLAMLLGLFPATALADEPGVEEPEITQEIVDLGDGELTVHSGPSTLSLSDGTLTNNGGNHEQWFDRIDFGTDEVKTAMTALYDALVEGSDNDNVKDYLIDDTYFKVTGTEIDNSNFSSLQAGELYQTTGLSSSIYVGKVSKNNTNAVNYWKKCIAATYRAFDYDHPEVFWLDGNSQMNMISDGTYTYFFFTLYNDSFDLRHSDYKSASKIENAISQVETKIGTIIGQATGSTKAEKVNQLNDWLTENNQYNTSNPLSSAPNSAHESISALLGKIREEGPVCEGYARALKVLCDKLSIPCVLVTGLGKSSAEDAGEAHMWNYVQLDDNNWYAVDTTWNDPVPVDDSGNAVSGVEGDYYLFVGGNTTSDNMAFSASHVIANQIPIASNGSVTEYLNLTNGPALSDTALVKSIAVTKEPTTKEYTVGESFDPTDMTLTATYWYTTGGTQATSTISGEYETAGVTWAPQTFSDTNETTVTITYGGQSAMQTVTVNNVSSAINIDSNITNGSISAKVGGTAVSGNVESGKTVTLTVTPETNYELVANSLKVTGPESQEVTVFGGDNTYTFTMPAFAVTVTAEFQQQTTDAPAFTSSEATLESAEDTDVTFTLSNAPSGTTTYQVYDVAAEGSVVSGVTATVSDSTLTLTFDTAPTTDTTYYISATESGKAESPRTPVTVKAYTKSSDATLSGLTISSGTLTPAFVSGTTSYTVEVPYSVSSVTVTPAVTDSKASVTVNNNSVTSGSTSNAIDLTAGQVNTITVRVTAENGTTQDYTITVNRAAAQYGISLSQSGTYTFGSLPAGYTEDNLTALEVTVTNTGDEATGELTVALSGTNKDNFVVEPATIASISATANNTATFTVKPNTGLSTGTYTATVTVSGGNGISAGFEVSFTVSASQDEVDVNNAKTAIEGAGAPTWTMAQAAANTESDVKSALVEKINRVISSASITGITVTTDNITVTGLTSAVEGTSDNHAGTNGSFGFTVTLTKGSASDTATVSGCAITATAYVPSSVTTLSGLTLSEGTLDPTFSGSVYAYTATVADTTDSITVTPTLTDTKASVTVNGKDASQPVSLTVGENTITVKVTAEDGTTTQTYTVTVTRPKPAYGVTLDVPAFANVAEGYTAPGRITVTVTNVGSSATDALTVALTGANASCFTVSDSTISDIAVGGSAEFTITYVSGLTAGTYTATVKVSNTNITSTGTVTLTVTPKAVTRTITFYPNGGSGSMSAVTVADGANYTLPACGFTAPSGMRFKCWAFGNASGNPYNVGSTMTIGTDVSFYAVWEPIPAIDPTPVVPSTPSTSRDDDDDGGDYSVSVPSSTSVEGGSVSVSPRSADKGDTVSITVRPKTGYVLDKLTVTTRTGAQVELTRKSETRYTFVMPAGSISVQVSFIPEEQAAEMDFADVPESFWAVNEIQWAFESGYMNGTSAASFNPGGTVNRQQVWMILARMAGADPASMAEAKAWAVANGISDGTTPTGAVTRQQLVALLYRFAAQNGYNVSNKADLSGYPDAASVSGYASDAMAWAVANGIIGGTTAGTLNPAGDSNRAQLAVILWRFYQTTAG